MRRQGKPREVIATFASLFDTQPPEVQDAFQFLLATAMHEAGKFEFLNVAEIDNETHYPFDTTIVRLEETIIYEYYRA